MKKGELSKKWNIFSAKYPKKFNSAFTVGIGAAWIVLAVMNPAAHVAYYGLGLAWAALGAYGGYSDYKNSKKKGTFVDKQGDWYEGPFTVVGTLYDMDQKRKNFLKAVNNPKNENDPMKPRWEKKLNSLDKRISQLVESQLTLVETAADVKKRIRRELDAKYGKF